MNTVEHIAADKTVGGDQNRAKRRGKMSTFIHLVAKTPNECRSYPVTAECVVCACARICSKKVFIIFVLFCPLPLEQGSDIIIIQIFFSFFHHCFI